MAKTPKTATALPLDGGSAENPGVQSGFEPEGQYLITLKYPVEHNGCLLSPRHVRTVVKGKVAEEIKDAIATAEKL